MKYLVFAYYKYYPSGGFDDLYNAYATKEEAQAVAKALEEGDDYDYVEVYNTDRMEEIIKAKSWIRANGCTQ